MVPLEEISGLVQHHHFAEDLKALSSSEKIPHVKKCTSLRSLDPILIDGLLRIGGGLSLASTPFESKHQIILPKNDHVTDLSRELSQDFWPLCMGDSMF